MIQLKGENSKTIWVNENNINYVTIDFPNRLGDNGEYLEYTLHFNDNTRIVARLDEELNKVLKKNNTSGKREEQDTKSVKM